MDMTKQIKYISTLTGRNVLAYYADFENPDKTGADMSCTDMSHFIAAVRKMDPQKGLDLILRVGAGNLLFAENLVKYLHTEFGRDIRIIIPDKVSREGTMLACAGKEILMSKKAGCFGAVPAEAYGEPVRVHLDKLVTAKKEIQEIQRKYNAEVLEMQAVEQAIAEAKLEKNKSVLPNLRRRLSNLKRAFKDDEKEFKYIQKKIIDYPLGTYYKLMDIRKLNERLIKDWLVSYHLEEPATADTEEKAKKIAKALTGDVEIRWLEQCIWLGLNVIPLEKDNALSTAVEELHGLLTESFKNSAHKKIIASSETVGTFLL